MIESMVLLGIFGVAGLVFVAARLQAQQARLNPEAELAKLRDSLAWHEARLQNATLKEWDAAMLAGITAQVTATRRRIAEITAAQAAASRQKPGR